ncbi:MAG: hypothetical protein GF317_24860 [Candidatus Lokiarchaeota archaeon]|nr:hypothetical protein [Candidatus Lokiarchaeota archaeon]
MGRNRSVQVDRSIGDSLHPIPIMSPLEATKFISFRMYAYLYTQAKIIWNSC